MKVTLDLPDNCSSLFTSANIAKEIKLYIALMLFKKRKISFSKGAELAEVPIYEFMSTCNEYEIPVINYSKEELQAEFEGIKQQLT